MDSSLSSVTIQQIIIFLNVAEYGGFAKAGTYLNMTQSAISKSIAKLEKELEIPLFQRTTRENHLTEAGLFLYNEWKPLLHALHSSYQKAVSVQKKNDNILHLGILNTAKPELYFWTIEERFVNEFPDVRLELESAYMTDLKEDLESGYYDLIMIPDFERFELADAGMCWKWAARSYSMVIMNKNHPLANHTSLKTKDILHEKFVILKQDKRKTYREDLTERFSLYHVKPDFVPGYKNAYELKYLFRKTENALLFTDAYFDCLDDSNLVKIPLQDQFGGIICAWNPDNVKPPIQNFTKLLKPEEYIPEWNK